MKDFKFKPSRSFSFREMYDSLGERGPADKKFKTDKVKGHSHLGTVDEDGTGKTIKTTGSGDDHVHKVTKGEIQPSGGHIHKLSMMESLDEKYTNKIPGIPSKAFDLSLIHI